MPKQHIKYGAVGFKPKVPSSQINRFIRNLPDSKRNSLYQVAEELQSRGLIDPSSEVTPTHNKNLYNKPWRQQSLTKKE